MVPALLLAPQATAVPNGQVTAPLWPRCSRPREGCSWSVPVSSYFCLDDDNGVGLPYWAQQRGIGGYRCGGSGQVLWGAVSAATPPERRRRRLLFFMND